MTHPTGPAGPTPGGPTGPGCELIIFQYGDAQIRTVTIDGEPWFVAADVARLLGTGGLARLAATPVADTYTAALERA